MNSLYLSSGWLVSKSRRNWTSWISERVRDKARELYDFFFSVLPWKKNDWERKNVFPDGRELPFAFTASYSSSSFLRLDARGKCFVQLKKKKKKKQKKERERERNATEIEGERRKEKISEMNRIASFWIQQRLLRRMFVVPEVDDDMEVSTPTEVAKPITQPEATKQSTPSPPTTPAPLENVPIEISVPPPAPPLPTKQHRSRRSLFHRNTIHVCDQIVDRM